MIENSKPIEILVIEDDDIDAKSIKRALEKLKILNKLHRARDGIEALALLRDDTVNITKRPYLILLDINMPRMNGLEFLAAIRGDDKLRNAIVFVLTTSKAEEDIKAAFDQNVAGYMVKSDLENGFVSAIELIDQYWRIVEMPTC